MDNIINENKLLKALIGTLEKENEARNIERNTLFTEIDKMNDQINRLNDLLSKSSKKNPSTPSSNKQITILKQAIQKLKKEMISMKGENSSMASDLLNKQNQINKLRQERQQLISQLQRFIQIEAFANMSKDKIIVLEEALKAKQIKLNENTQLQQSYKLSIIKITELQALNKALNDDCRRMIEEIENRRNVIIQLQNSNQALNNSKQPNNQISNLLSVKANLEATIKRLTSKVEWHQSNSKSYEQQRLHCDEKFRAMELKLKVAQSNIAQFKAKEQTVANLQASKAAKSQEIQALQKMIINLKDNKLYLQKCLKEKIQKITILESQISKFTIKEFDKRALEEQINILQQNKYQIDSQNNQIQKNYQSLLSQMNKMKEKEKNYVLQVNSLRGERESLLQEVDQYSNLLEDARRQIKTYQNRINDYTFNVQQETTSRNRAHRDIRNNNDDDIRLKVLRLQQQIENMKYKQGKGQFAMDNSQVESYISINNRSQLMLQNRSPPHFANNEKEKVSQGKNKWEHLQKKIAILRNQNQTLKRTLFD